MRAENDLAPSMRWRMTAVTWKSWLNQGQRRCRSFNEVCAQGDHAGFFVSAWNLPSFVTNTSLSKWI